MRIGNFEIKRIPNKSENPLKDGKIFTYPTENLDGIKPNPVVLKAADEAERDVPFGKEEIEELKYQINQYVDQGRAMPYFKMSTQPLYNNSTMHMRRVKYSWPGNPINDSCEGFLHQWILSSNGGLLAVVESLGGVVSLIPFKYVSFIDRHDKTEDTAMKKNLREKVQSETRRSEISLIDYFATKAMHGFLEESNYFCFSDVAKNAYIMADEMLAERARRMDQNLI